MHVHLHATSFIHNQNSPHKFSIKDFFSKCDQIRSKLEDAPGSLLRIWSHLLKKPIMENFVFYTVTVAAFQYLKVR